MLAACSSSGDTAAEGSAEAPSAAASAAESATDAAAAPAAEPVSVVATTQVLGDIAGQVATCAGASIETLIPAGADSHDFAPSSAQVASMVNADLLVVNGLGLEGGMIDAIESAKADGARLLSVGELVDPLPAPTIDAHAHSDEAGHS
ncbi:MAG TPA: zinc ABC transporter substrate-binding protein, partial [Actinobacteria bacterium]|nr:zinc ABC transporter substrate-binding protein [Actinomycetota bacterium]